MMVRETEMKEASPIKNDKTGPTLEKIDCISTVTTQKIAAGAVPNRTESTVLYRQQRTPKRRT